jgi:hypothetical protein
MFRGKKNKSHEAIEAAKKIAQQMINGAIDIYVGCDEIAEICAAHDFPDILLDIYHLAHLKDGHEDFGFNRNNLREDIMVEAKKLIL